jgi:hypothetical protein
VCGWGAARGLYRFDGTLLRLVDAAATYVDSMAEDDAGNLWGTDRSAIVRRLARCAGALRLDPRIRLPLPGWRIMADGRGGLLVASFSGGLFRLGNPTGAHPLLEPIEYEHRLRDRRERSIAIATAASGWACAAACCAFRKTPSNTPDRSKG